MLKMFPAIALVAATLIVGGGGAAQAQNGETPPAIDESIEVVPLENVQQAPEGPRAKRPRRIRRERPPSPPPAAEASQVPPAAGNPAAASSEQPQDRGNRIADAERDRANQGVIAIISGGINGTYVRIASDMAAVLDDSKRLRILPVIGKGSLQNITDLLYMRGIDVAIVQSDVLEFIRKQNLHPTLDQRLRYVTKLYNEEVHILAGRGTARLADLAGKKVNIDTVGSGTAITAATLFDALGVSVEATNFDQPLALDKLRKGEIAAMVYVAGKPAGLFHGIEPGSGLHFLSVPLTADLLRVYLPSSLTHIDYPAVVDENRPADTVAVGAVMAVYNWERDSDRYRRTAAFVSAFFDNFAEFLKPPRHPKWQEVNLAADLPGWTRFPAAQEWLDRRPTPAGAGYDLALKSSFDEFLKFMEESRGGGSGAQSREALFADFLAWRAARSPAPLPAPPAVPR